MLVRTLLLAVLLAAGCGVPQKDVQALLTLLDAATGTSGDSRQRILYQGCSEIPSCADKCARELSFCASADADDAQRGAVLSQCGLLPRGEPLASGVRTYLSRYVDRAAKVATPEARQKLADYRDQLAL
jgi:hypothetical protein